MTLLHKRKQDGITEIRYNIPKIIKKYNPNVIPFDILSALCHLTYNTQFIKEDYLIAVNNDCKCFNKDPFKNTLSTEFNELLFRMHISQNQPVLEKKSKHIKYHILLDKLEYVLNKINYIGYFSSEPGIYKVQSMVVPKLERVQTWNSIVANFKSGLLDNVCEIDVFDISENESKIVYYNDVKIKKHKV